MSTDLRTSEWLHRVAQGIETQCPGCSGTGQPLDISSRKEICRGCDGSGRVQSYASTGIGGWLLAKKGSEWPSLAWWKTSRKSNYISHGTALDTEWDLDYFKAPLVAPEVKYIHALDYPDAFILLEEADWGFEYKTGWGYKAARDWGSEGRILEADSPEDLLDKIREAVEKHG